VYNKFEAKHCTYGGPFVGPQNQLVAFISPSSGPCISDILHKAHLKKVFFLKVPLYVEIIYVLFSKKISATTKDGTLCTKGCFLSFSNKIIDIQKN
jgi:hypothetical protein